MPQLPDKKASSPKTTTGGSTTKIGLIPKQPKQGGGAPGTAGPPKSRK